MRRPVLHTTDSCFRKHKYIGLETRLHNGCDTCNLHLNRDRDLQVKYLFVKSKSWIQKLQYITVPVEFTVAGRLETADTNIFSSLPPHIIILMIGFIER